MTERAMIVRLTKRRLERCTDYPDVPRPRTRGECVADARPCPWVSCRYHLFLEALPSSSGRPGLKFNFPSREPWELEETCSLDIADRRGATLREVGSAMNLTRERVRQLEEIVLRKVAAAGAPELTL